MMNVPVQVPSPCIDICKYSRRGHCVGCSMTQAQKRLFGGLKSLDQRADFVQMIRDQQDMMGRYDHWEASYSRKCHRVSAGEPERS